MLQQAAIQFLNTQHTQKEAGLSKTQTTDERMIASTLRGVLVHDNALYKLTFYLLTYLLRGKVHTIGISSMGVKDSRHYYTHAGCIWRSIHISFNSRFKANITMSSWLNSRCASKHIFKIMHILISSHFKTKNDFVLHFCNIRMY